MAARRGRGEGSITRRPDGRWMARVHLGTLNGRRRYKAFYGRTRRDVAAKLAEAIHNLQHGEMPLDARMTLAAFLKTWLEHKRSTLRPRAWATYELKIRRHIVPGLGQVPLARLTPAHIEDWFRRHRAEGASVPAIRAARVVLRAALNQARKWRLVRENAAALVDPPRHRPREISPLTPQQARRLLRVAKDHRLGALISLGLALGLRLGEALGLQWSDIDFDAGTLSVRRQLERSGGDVAARLELRAQERKLKQQLAASAPGSAERQGILESLTAVRERYREQRSTIRFTEPKSATSRRTLRMPQVVVDALRAHRRRQLEERMAAGSAWVDSGLVFTTPIGTPLDLQNATRDFPALLAAAGLPRITFHCLRHTAATLLLGSGVDPRTIMETLGHSQISLTLNTYAHVLPALQGEAAARLDDVLGGGAR